MSICIHSYILYSHIICDGRSHVHTHLHTVPNVYACMRMDVHTLCYACMHTHTHTHTGMCVCLCSQLSIYMHISPTHKHHHSCTTVIQSCILTVATGEGSSVRSEAAFLKAVIFFLIGILPPAKKREGRAANGRCVFVFSDDLLPWKYLTQARPTLKNIMRDLRHKRPGLPCVLAVRNKLWALG